MSVFLAITPGSTHSPAAEVLPGAPDDDAATIAPKVPNPFLSSASAAAAGAALSTARKRSIHALSLNERRACFENYDGGPDPGYGADQAFQAQPASSYSSAAQSSGSLGVTSERVRTPSELQNAPSPASGGELEADEESAPEGIKRKPPFFATTSVNGRANSRWFQGVQGALVDPANVSSLASAPASRAAPPGEAAAISRDDSESVASSFVSAPVDTAEAPPRESLPCSSFPIGSIRMEGPSPVNSQNRSVFMPPPDDYQVGSGADAARGNLLPADSLKQSGVNENGLSSAVAATPIVDRNDVVAVARKCDKCRSYCEAFTSCLSYFFCLQWLRG